MRQLGSARVAEISVLIAYAALDAGADPDAVIAAWARIGEAMPLALGLAQNAIEARPKLPDDLAQWVTHFVEEQRERDRKETT